MRKITIFLAIAAIALPSVANAKGKKHHRHHKPVVTAPSDPNAPGRKLVWNGLMLIFVPMQSMTK